MILQEQEKNYYLNIVSFLGLFTDGHGMGLQEAKMSTFCFNNERNLLEVYDIVQNTSNFSPTRSNKLDYQVIIYNNRKFLNCIWTELLHKDPYRTKIFKSLHIN